MMTDLSNANVFAVGIGSYSNIVEDEVAFKDVKQSSRGNSVDVMNAF